MTHTHLGDTRLVGRLRVLLSKIGLDGHDRGVKVVASMLRDAGIDVIYLGIHHTSDAIVSAAIQEDVDLIGLSSLGGTHLTHAREVLDLLRRHGRDHLPVVVGGTVPVEDISALEAAGVRAVLPPGSSRSEIIATITQLGECAREAEGTRPRGEGGESASSGRQVPVRRK